MSTASQPDSPTPSEVGGVAHREDMVDALLDLDLPDVGDRLRDLADLLEIQPVALDDSEEGSVRAVARGIVNAGRYRAMMRLLVRTHHHLACSGERAGLRDAMAHLAGMDPDSTSSDAWRFAGGPLRG